MKLRPAGHWILASALLGQSTIMSHAAQPAPPSAAAEGAAELDALHRAGKLLFDHVAPADIKAKFDFPTKEKWDSFVTKFRRALEGDSLQDLAACAAEGRSALSALRMVPGYEDLADWLEQRIDSFEGAQQALRPAPPPPKPAPTKPGQPAPPTPPVAFQPVPHYDLWMSRVRTRPIPKNAAALMPKLRAAFSAEGVPPELVWIAEAESSLNPVARSPVGAKGLFQFMPETAQSMGLSTSLPDERTDPEKSARAAARYLKVLHGKFGNWALVLAAYNAGEGRVRRTMTKSGAKSFTAISDSLPAETRMYVPKVCALIATRAGVTPDKIGKPTAR
jgi:membrane-bound lytic murein transglycosylase D